MKCRQKLSGTMRRGKDSVMKDVGIPTKLIYISEGRKNLSSELQKLKFLEESMLVSKKITEREQRSLLQRAQENVRLLESIRGQVKVSYQGEKSHEFLASSLLSFQHQINSKLNKYFYCGIKNHHQFNSSTSYHLTVSVARIWYNLTGPSTQGLTECQ